jgi:hypothetical protein
LFCREKGKTSFCEQKEAKKLFYAGPEALSPTKPITQHNKSFCAAFFKKRLLSFSDQAHDDGVRRDAK